MAKELIPNEIELYNYRAKVVRVIDGDSIRVNIDMGMYQKFEYQNIRLARIDAPELRGDSLIAARESRDWLKDKVLDKTVYIKTYKDKKGKYGRWVADIYMDDICLNDKLVELNLAKYYP